MSNAAARLADSARIARLIPRVEACVANLLDVEPHGLAQQHGVVYAAWLADALHGRIRLDAPTEQGMLDMATEFCDLVEREYRHS
ncbi:hypothetical protein AB4Y43_17055 [Paraburkholderia sp. BR10872]|uniref:hypothetical protein n=1 Tax=Paraburkholderia sp. BR10872 TaxID=3236989 RepID=UPI0034D23695